MVITSPPVTHNLGIAMPNNQPVFLLKKGDPLPALARMVYHTAFTFRKGQEGDLIRIPVIEGEDTKRADRNDLLGCLEIPSNSIKHDVPAGSDVEITIYMDESRLLTTKAYIPIIDEEFEKVINFETKQKSIEELKEDFEREKRRYYEACKKACSANSLKAQEAVAKIEDEDAIGNVQSLLNASEEDACAEPEFQNQLTDLKIAIDEIEDALEWPSLLAEIEDKLKWCKQIVDQYGDSTEKEKFRSLETEVQMAIDSGDPDLLRRYNEELQALGFEVLTRQPGFWVGKFRDLANLAEQLISQGHNAINRNDIEGLKAVVRQLNGLLFTEKQQRAMRGYGGIAIL
jgi:molecular chaperone DnaK